MAARYAYNYAVIYRPLHICNEVRTTTGSHEGLSNETYLYVEIPSYDSSYLLKYYDEENKKWYLDADFEEEWIPPVA